MNLSRFFTLAEMCHSNTAVAERIPNLPGDADRAHLAALCTQVLDPLREAVGQSIRVNSGYRGPALNARLRGATSSQHLKGQAADIQTAAVSVLELFKMVIRLGLPFDQVIFEAKNATSKWVHVSHNPAGNRGEIRVAEFDANGKPVRYPQVTAEQALALVDRVTRSSRPGQWPDYHETSDEPEHEGLLAGKPAPAPAPAPSAQTAPVKVVAAKKRLATTVAAKQTPAAKPPVAKPATRGAAVKTSAAKQAPVKQTPVKKAAVKAAPPTKAAARKLTGRAAPASKAAAAKAPAKKVSAKKAAVNKAAVNKAPVKKAVAQKVPAKKAVAGPLPAEAAAGKNAPAKKAPAKKAPAKKAPAKRNVGR